MLGRVYLSQLAMVGLMIGEIFNYLLFTLEKVQPQTGEEVPQVRAS